MSENNLFLGIDGGQSHTEAVIADEKGNVLGIGSGGALDHGNLPEGRERLKNAIYRSVSEALQKAGLPGIAATYFASVHCGLTGGADYKEDIIRQIIEAPNLVVGHDASTALFGATGGEPGIVVIAGTGSMVFGINKEGKTARSGGLGFIFSDEGSGFWLSAETIKLAIKEQDQVIGNAGLESLVLEFFKVDRIRELTNAFYNNRISRDRIAGFAEMIAKKAGDGNEILHDLIEHGARCLVENVKGTARQLGFENSFTVSTAGGMFRGNLLKRFFVEILNRQIQSADFTEPIFPPPIGALLLAYRQVNIEINEQVLSNLKTSYECQISAR